MMCTTALAFFFLVLTQSLFFRGKKGGMIMTTRRKIALEIFCVFVATALAMTHLRTLEGKAKGPVDPGVRGGAAGAGGPLNNLAADESSFFQDGFARFGEFEVIERFNQL